MEFSWRATVLSIIPLYLGWKYVKATDELAKTTEQREQLEQFLRSKLAVAYNQLAFANRIIERTGLEVQRLQEGQEVLELTVAQLEAERYRLQSANSAAAARENRLRADVEVRKKAWDEERKSLENHYQSKLQEAVDQLCQAKTLLEGKEKAWIQEKKALQAAEIDSIMRLQQALNQLDRSNSENASSQQLIQTQKKQISQLSKKLEGLLDVKYIKKLQEDLAISNLQVSELRKELAEKEDVVRRLQHDLISMREKAAEGERLEAKNKSMEALVSQVKSQQEKERVAMQQELHVLREQVRTGEEAAELWRVRFEGMSQRCLELQCAADAREREVKSLPLQPEVVFLPLQPVEVSLSLQSGDVAHSTSKATEHASEIAKECVVCMDRDKSMLLEPCCHLCVCQPCSKSLRQCPLCSRAIKRRKFVYF